jgi:hypothetical protein
MIVSHYAAIDALLAKHSRAIFELSAFSFLSQLFSFSEDGDDSYFISPNISPPPPDTPFSLRQQIGRHVFSRQLSFSFQITSPLLISRRHFD